jgi:SAM-dependent methyltransferase
MDGSEPGWPSRLKSAVRGVVRRTGFDVVRSRDNRGGVDDFIPFEPTVRAAQSAGMSIGDYIDAVMNGTPGATASTIARLDELGVFADDPVTILEIGPGSGRYLEKTLQVCSPRRYEIYETAVPWRDYLVETYQVVAQPTEGSSLAPTPDGSVDLVMAHKVFNTVTFLLSSRYFLDMARVTRPGGRIVFDAMTETCLDPDTVRAWATKGGGGHDSYPAAMPRATVVDLFATLGCTLQSSFLAPMGFASTEVLVFRKDY